MIYDVPKLFESRDSHNSLIEVATQISSSKVCWVLYKSILLYNMFIGLFQSSLDISCLFIKYLTFSPIMVVQLYNEYLTIWLYNWFGLFIKVHINLILLFSNTVFIEHVFVD